MGMPTPVFDRVIVRPHMEPAMSKGGIHIPDSARKIATSGEVLAVGPGRGLDEFTDLGGKKKRLHLPMSIKVGDAVYYGEYVGQQMKVGGETFIVLQETDVLGYERNGE